MAQKKHTFKNLDDYQMKWIEITKIIMNSNPPHYAVQQTKFLKKIFFLKKYKIIARVKIVILLANLCLLCSAQAITMNNESDFDIFMYFMVTIFYFFEIVLSFLEHGVRSSLTLWNFVKIFIFLVYLIKIQLIFEMAESIEVLKNIKRSEKAYRIFNLLTILPVARILKKFKGLKKLADFLYFSFPMIFNLIFLLVFIFFIYATCGCLYFYDLKSEILDEYVNFSNIFFSLITLFRISTGDDWVTLMNEVIERDEQDTKTIGTIKKKYIKIFLKNFIVRNYFFFISFMFLSYFFLMNLFSLTLLKQFEEFYINFNSPLQSYKENLNRFKLIWSYYSNKNNRNTIKVHNLLGFFKMLGSPLGCKSNDKISEIGVKLKELNIRRQINIILV